MIRPLYCRRKDEQKGGRKKIPGISKTYLRKVAGKGFGASFIGGHCKVDGTVERIGINGIIGTAGAGQTISVLIDVRRRRTEEIVQTVIVPYSAGIRIHGRLPLQENTLGSQIIGSA